MKEMTEKGKVGTRWEGKPIKWTCGRDMVRLDGWHGSTCAILSHWSQVLIELVTVEVNNDGHDGMCMCNLVTSIITPGIISAHLKMFIIYSNKTLWKANIRPRNVANLSRRPQLALGAFHVIDKLVTCRVLWIAFRHKSQKTVLSLHSPQAVQ